MVPVRDVFEPKATNPSDPSSTNNENKDASYWENQKKETRARREVMQEEQMIKELQNQPGQSGVTQPEFKVEGGIKLNIDPQRDAAEARQAMQAQQTEHNQKIGELTDELRKTQQDLVSAQMTGAMKEMGGQLAQAIKDVDKKIEEYKAGANPENVVSSYENLIKIAQKMGFQTTAEAGDPHIVLEIKKLELENARAEREFKMLMEQNRREWDLKLQEMADNRDFQRAQIANEARKNEMFANAPQSLGSAIAKGILANEGQGGSQQRPQQQPQQHHIEANWGDSGEINCPGCGQIIAIGPTARAAVCANCNTRVPIKRIGTRPSQGAPAPIEEEEE